MRQRGLSARHENGSDSAGRIWAGGSVSAEFRHSGCIWTRGFHSFEGSATQGVYLPGHTGLVSACVSSPLPCHSSHRLCSPCLKYECGCTCDLTAQQCDTNCCCDSEVGVPMSALACHCHPVSALHHSVQQMKCLHFARQGSAQLKGLLTLRFYSAVT